MGRYPKDNVSNKHYDSDINRTFRMTEWLLTPLGLWTLVSKNPSRNDIYTSIGMITICMTTLLWVILPCTRHLAFIEQDRNIRMTKIGPVSYCYKSIMLYSAIILSSKRIKRCIEHIKSDWCDLQSDEDRQIMIKNLAFGRKITIVCGIFIYSGGLSYHSVMPLWSGSQVNSRNETIRPLVYPGYDEFVDSQTTPAYEIIFTAQFLTAVVACNITTASCNLTATFVGHALGQIQIVMIRIRRIVDEDRCRNVNPEGRIASVIRGHVSALRLAAEIEKVLRGVCLVEVFGSTFIMCTVEYYFIKEWSNSDSIVLLTYIALFFSLSFNIFLFCHIGEILMDKCHGIGKLVYTIDWYRLPGRASLPLGLIIAISHCPRRLSAGGLLSLSMNSFAAIMRTSMGYLNLLYTMEDNND